MIEGKSWMVKGLKRLKEKPEWNAACLTWTDSFAAAVKIDILVPVLKWRCQSKCIYFRRRMRKLKWIQKDIWEGKWESEIKWIFENKNKTVGPSMPQHCSQPSCIQSIRFCWSGSSLYMRRLKLVVMISDHTCSGRWMPGNHWWPETWSSPWKWSPGCRRSSEFEMWANKKAFNPTKKRKDTMVMFIASYCERAPQAGEEWPKRWHRPPTRLCSPWGPPHILWILQKPYISQPFHPIHKSKKKTIKGTNQWWRW